MQQGQELVDVCRALAEAQEWTSKDAPLKGFVVGELPHRLGSLVSLYADPAVMTLHWQPLQRRSSDVVAREVVTPQWRAFSIPSLVPCTARCVGAPYPMQHDSA